MQIREHVGGIKPRHLQQPYYFTRWFRCVHADCATKLVMAERFKVFTDVGREQLVEREREQTEAAEIAAAADDIVMQVANEMADADADMPW